MIEERQSLGMVRFYDGYSDKGFEYSWKKMIESELTVLITETLDQ